MCESLFPCQTSVEEIKKEALLVSTSPITDANFPSTGLFSTLFAPTMTTGIFNPSRQRVEGRSTCKITGALCPGITIGCALCGVFAPVTCGDTCIIAGLYCGTSGYACQYEASLNEENENDTDDDDEGNEDEVPSEEEPEEPVTDVIEPVTDEPAVDEPALDGGEPRRKNSRARFYPFHFQ